MGSSSLYKYVQVLKQLESYSNIPQDIISSLSSYTLSIYCSDQENMYSEPLRWIGIYIALASLFCILAIGADILHGLRNGKFWFPCKYFTLNAASLSVIAIAMKLPMDLNNSMPGNVDQTAKLGSMAFMCTIMSNFMPSLANMNTKELVTNIIALGVLVITLVVNVCIQIKTGVVSYSEAERFNDIVADVKPHSPYIFVYINRNRSIAIIYVVMLLMLLIIQVCSAFTILMSKEILKSKYEARHKTALKAQELQYRGRLTAKILKQLVSNYWIMAGTGNPQFITSCYATSVASGVICSFSTIIHVIIMILTIGTLKDHGSDYKWSMLVILIIQFIGVVLGTIAPLSRCFATLNFKLSKKWISNHVNVFKVESYWTQKMSDWKQSSIPFSISNRKSKIVIQKFIILILSICIGFQNTVVVACKMIALIPISFVICVLYCIHCLKWLKLVSSDSGTMLDIRSRQQDSHIDLSYYVLQHQDEMELAERTLKKISNSMDRLVKKAEKQQPCHLMKLLEGSINFEGVEFFDSHQSPPLFPLEPLNCWSLPVVTLTSIALSLPKIQNDTVDNLLRSVSEGLVYVMLVEESLNSEDEYVSIQKVAKMLWLEVEVYRKWLGNKLQNTSPQVNTARQILEWFRDIAKNMVMEVEGMDIVGSNINLFGRCICANSMYRITQTILLSYQDNTDEVSQEELFMIISSMISDILAACLTNIPQVIAMKCHTSMIEKREVRVHAAAQLLGETTQIINMLQDRELPSLNPCDLACIDKWRTYLQHPFPKEPFPIYE